MDRLFKYIALSTLALLISDYAVAKSAKVYEEHEGELSVQIVENIDQQQEEIVYELTVPGQDKRYQLDLPGRPPFALRTGQKVRLLGKELPGKRLGVKDIQLLALDTGKSSETNKTAAVTKTPTGVRSSAVILINLLDNSAILTAATAEQNMWGDTNSVQDIYFSDSRGAIDFVRDSDNDGLADIYGPVNVSMNSKDSCDYRMWSDAARQQLAAEGLSLEGRDHYIYVIPNYSYTACTFSGMAELGGDETWVASKTAFVLLHEIGHNLNLHHAGTDSDNDGVIDNAYGDNSCFMGASYRNTFTNAPHKFAMGILGAKDGSIVDMPTTPGTYNYILEPTALSANVAIDPQIIRIPRSDLGRDYYVSIRDNTSYDTNLSSTYRSGVSVHWYDTTKPGTATAHVTTLRNGESFVDGINGITITQNAAAADGSWADVSVRMGVVYEVNVPTFSLKSMTGQFPEITIGEGEVAQYAVKLTNNDGADTPATKWSLKLRGLPAGMIAAFDRDTFTLAPGATATAILNVESNGVVDGTYQFYVDAVDADGQEPHHRDINDYGRVVVETRSVVPDAPTSLEGTFYSSKGKTYVKLDWVKSSSADVALYHVVFEDGSVDRQFYSTSATSINVLWTEGTGDYTFRVVAESESGKASEPSEPVTLTNSKRKKVKDSLPPKPAPTLL